jgi:hypothetical protein
VQLAWGKGCIGILEGGLKLEGRASVRTSGLAWRPVRATCWFDVLCSLVRLEGPPRGGLFLAPGLDRQRKGLGWAP